MRNVVLTVSSGFSTENLWPFVDSFRKTREKTSALVIFVNRSKLIHFGHGKPLDKATEKFLLSHADELVGFKCMSLRMRRPSCLLWPLWKWVFPRMKTDKQRRKLGIKVVSMVFSRALLYLNYLESLPEKPKWVLLTDCRDAVFQKDIFSELKEPGLYCFLEAEDKTIASCWRNSSMIRNCFGEEGLKEVRDFMVSCSGTVLGDYDNMVQYLRTAVEYTFKVRKMKMCGGDDQGLHNYLIHKKLVPNIRLVKNDNGPIGTLGAVSGDEIRLSPHNFVLQQDGQPYALLHQHDRHSFIVKIHPACQSKPPLDKF